MSRVNSVAIGALLFTVVYLLTTSDGITASSQDPGSLRSSVAVLPYLNVSGDVENEYLSDSLWVETIDSLTKIQGLRVATRSSSLRFKNTEEDIQTIGEALRVSYVVEGSVGQFDSLVRIVIKLIRVDDGTYVWTITYVRDVNSTESTPVEIAESIAAILGDSK